MPDMNVIDTLVKELLASEPSLKMQEEQLRKAITALLDAKPDVPRDERFYANLRKELLNSFAAARAATHAPEIPMNESFIAKFHRAMTAHPFYVPAAAIAGVLVIVAVAAPRTGLMPGLNGSPSKGTRSVALGGGMVVRPTSVHAFGNLVSSQSAAGANAEAGAVAPSQGSSGKMAFGLGGGGGGISTTAGAPTPTAPMMAPNAAAVDGSVTGGARIMPYPGPQTYLAYEYSGDPLTLADAQVNVLRRIKGAGTGADAIKGLLPTLLDFGRFDTMKLQSFSGYEDKEFGLSVYADLMEENVSLSQYYPKWPHPESGCRDQACYDAQRIKESDIPSDADALAAADAFLTERGISKEGYGAPQIQNDWRRWYAMTPQKSDYYFPEQVSVVYPMMANDMRVVDESGQPFGMSVNINVRSRRAEGVYNLFTRNYESAAYDAETDSAKILEIAQRGGTYGWMPEGTDVKKIVVHLGTPERVLLRTWQYANDGTGKELLVPALRFPTIEKSVEGGIVPQEAVVVPLVKELLQSNGGGPIIYMQGKGVGGTSGSGTVSLPPATTSIAPKPNDPGAAPGIAEPGN
ncbi:MAG: hypothetical protein RLZZ324_17 [Candidatus Parcubacteria bacterium]|jgi:hypothetical protein